MKSMTAVEMSTAHIVEQRTISRQIYLLQSVTVPSHHHYATDNLQHLDTTYLLPPRSQPRFMFCAFAIHSLSQAKIFKRNFWQPGQGKTVLEWQDRKLFGIISYLVCGWELQKMTISTKQAGGGYS